MKDLEALPIEIDGYTIYVTGMEDTKDGIQVQLLPDETLPEHFTDEFISKAICDIITTRFNEDKKKGLIK